MTSWRQKEVVTVKEAAEILRVSIATVRRRMEEGKLNYIQFRVNTMILIPVSEIRRLLDGERGD